MYAVCHDCADTTPLTGLDALELELTGDVGDDSQFNHALLYMTLLLLTLAWSHMWLS